MSECVPLRVGDEFFVHFTDKKREKLRSSSAFKIKYEGIWLTVVHIYEQTDLMRQKKYIYVASTLEDLEVFHTNSNIYRPERYFWYPDDDFQEIRRKPPESTKNTPKNSLPFV